MHRSRSAPFAPLAAMRLLALLTLAAGLLLGSAPPTHAADGITLTGTAFLGGNVRQGGWAAVRVDVSNEGPDVQGELRIRSSQQGRSIYGVEADLPSGARKQFVLYTQPPVFGSRLVVELVRGDASLATAEIAIRMRDPYLPLVGIVAERPEGFQRDIQDALQTPDSGQAVVILLRPDELPTRVEALASLDRLVWQDVDTSNLTAEQLAALELWIGAGGQLVIVGGSTGPGTLRGFPAELLPFVPERTIDVGLADLRELLGSLPAEASSLPALGGTFRQGAVLGRSGDSVYAARMAIGQGSVAVIGIDPGAAWLSRSDAAGALWRRVMPAAAGQFQSPFFLPDESSIFQNALYNLPSVALPPIEQLFVLLLAYIALIGPINYIVLRRLDRREWAWLTMPLLVAVFAVGSYGLGAALKGSDVIVNEVAIVRAGQGATRGVGQVYVGVFSPTRRTFEVRVPGGALLSSPSSQNQFGQAEQPVDALFGDTVSRLRNFEVGFGVIRGFRADVPVSAPSVSAELRLVNGRIQGTVTNGSDAPLEHVGVLFGSTVMAIPSLAAGETKEISMQPRSGDYYALSERLFGSLFSRDPAVQRKINTRRAVIDQLSGYGPSILGTSPDVALMVGWQENVALEVELAGEPANRVGDSLYVVPLSVTYDRQALFDDPLIVRTLIDPGAEQGWGDRNSYALDRGTLTLELRPAGLSGRFTASSLTLAVTQGGFFGLRGEGVRIAPLPDEQQPPQDDPLGSEPTASSSDCLLPPCDDVVGDDKPMAEPWPGEMGMPQLQLFDHAAGRWYELPEMADTRAYTIEEPQRWVDDSGRVLIRAVNRAQRGDVRWFQLVARMEGTIE